ncbi:hypothetical protein FNV43_RR24783 [Rhamnella rubrinervis]|uniref:Uncharacterized protein n=1 Tax=Rhamnella rubrinervis TaxID=2594499 RepID=A0A8K0DTS0_9ROSA|nr:hypothetical protein FNV43_RR24783 [Rhamnella rubrinervis]
MSDTESVLSTELGELEEAECVTPRDSRSRIPEPLVCPPAPTKKSPYLKPKQLPTRYYEDVVANSEVDRYFDMLWEGLKHSS